ncbi:MAG TPA: hypothetical protein HA258_04210 [Thermoplasmata archaeon]|jgi:hypothetical protein|nr:hypothetical protein [Thermoplasmata archaeon]HIH28863.1 hypothetical protein [Thermoplasmata archaeon]
MDEAPITPIKEEKMPTYNKKAIRLIGVMITGGIVLGLILSSIFITETNNKIQEYADEIAELFGGNIPPFINIRITPLTTTEIILPTLGVVIVCISMFLLIGLIAVYFKVYAKTKSKYIFGLFFVLIPLFIESIFLVYALRQLFAFPIIPALPPGPRIGESIGFEWGGLGQILVIISIFESIGLSILLYLSNE